MRFDVLDRIVAGVGVERVDRIHAVEAITAAVTALKNFHVYPGSLLDDAAESDHAKIADAGTDLMRHRRRKRLHYRVGKLIAGRKPRDHRGRKDRIGKRALRRNDTDRAGDAVVLWNIAVH